MCSHNSSYFSSGKAGAVHFFGGIVPGLILFLLLLLLVAIQARRRNYPKRPPLAAKSRRLLIARNYHRPVPKSDPRRPITAAPKSKILN
jgi:hypothetical protein